MIVEVKGLIPVIESLKRTPKQIKRANKSALGSVGFFFIGELKKQINTQGSYAGGKWKPQHPLTRLPKKRTGKTQRLRLRQNKPLSGLKKFTRYRVSDNAVQILFARSRKGRVGSFDRLMNEFVRRSEFGESQTLTKKSKRFRAARGFPVRKGTNKIRIVPRQTVGPVFRRNRRKVVPIYRDKFSRSIERQVQQEIDKRRGK